MSCCGRSSCRHKNMLVLNFFLFELFFWWITQTRCSIRWFYTLNHSQANIFQPLFLVKLTSCEVHGYIDMTVVSLVSARKLIIVFPKCWTARSAWRAAAVVELWRGCQVILWILSLWLDLEAPQAWGDKVAAHLTKQEPVCFYPE